MKLIKSMSNAEFASVLTTILTAVGTFYLAIAKIWDLPFGEEVSNTFYALVALVSSALGAFTMNKISGRNK